MNDSPSSTDTITLNGKPRDIEGQPTITALLETLDIRAEQVAVAVNGEVVPRREWLQTRVASGDSIEVVRAVGGG